MLRTRVTSRDVTAATDETDGGVGGVKRTRRDLRISITRSDIVVNSSESCHRNDVRSRVYFRLDIPPWPDRSIPVDQRLVTRRGSLRARRVFTTHLVYLCGVRRARSVVEDVGFETLGSREEKICANRRSWSETRTTKTNK